MIEKCDDKVLPNILFLFEHKDREKFLAKLLYDNLRSSNYVIFSSVNYSGLSGALFKKFSLIITPNRNPISDFFSHIYGVPVLYLNYEQVLSKLNKQLKIPAVSSNDRDLHVGWSENFRDYLLDKGIKKPSVFLLNPPQFPELCRELHRRQLFIAEANKRLNIRIQDYENVIFFAPTCLQAFKSNFELLRISIFKGVKYKELVHRKQRTIKNLEVIYDSLRIVKKNSLIIVRPHPSVKASKHEPYIRKFLSQTGGAEVICTSEFTALQWLTVADEFLTNYSSLVLSARDLGIKSTVISKHLAESVLPPWLQDEVLERDKLKISENQAKHIIQNYAKEVEKLVSVTLQKRSLAIQPNKNFIEIFNEKNLQVTLRFFLKLFKNSLRFYTDKILHNFLGERYLEKDALRDFVEINPK